MKKVLCCMFVFLFCLVVFSGCKQSPTPAPNNQNQPQNGAQNGQAGPQPGGTFKIISAYCPGAPVGWPLDVNMQSFWLIDFMYAEPLLIYHWDGSVEPCLAESWRLSDDLLSITFQLRKGVKFHDGTDFNARAVQFMIESNLNEQTAASKNWESVVVVDDYTVQLNLVKFENTLWETLSSTNAMIVSPTAVDEKGLDWIRENPIGTGPFKLTSFVRDEHAKFVKNDHYWQAGKPYLDAVEFVFVKDPMAQQNALKSGEGHYLTLQDGRVLDEFEKLGYVAIGSPGGTTMLVPDSANKDSKFADIRVRQAINYAINKEAVASTLGSGYMVPNNQIIPQRHPFRNPTIPESVYDPQKAKELLAEAGYPSGFKTKLLLFGAYSDYALMVQQMLAAVGIESEIDLVENLKFWEYSREGWSNAIMVTGHLFRPNFANTFKQQFPPYSTTGNKSLKPPASLAALIDEAIKTPDFNQQKALNQQIVKDIYEDMMIIPIVTAIKGHVVAPEVQDADFMFGADGMYSWRPADTWLSKK